MSDESEGSDGFATTGVVHGGEGSSSSSEWARLRRLTSKLIGFAVGRREALSTRRREATRPGRVYTDGPHRGGSGPDATRAARPPAEEGLPPLPDERPRARRSILSRIIGRE